MFHIWKKRSDGLSTIAIRRCSGCIPTLIDHQRFAERVKTDPSAGQIGAGGAWFRFGYDLFTIRDNAKLHARLRERLLNAQDFQAARHELAVAAICVSAGFEPSSKMRPTI